MRPHQEKEETVKIQRQNETARIPSHIKDFS